NSQNVMWICWTIHKSLTATNKLAFSDGNMLTFWYQVFALLANFWGYNHALLTLKVLTKAYITIDLSNNRSLFWFTCFEELGHSRKTARDITSFCGLSVDLRNHIASMNFLS